MRAFRSLFLVLCLAAPSAACTTLAEGEIEPLLARHGYAVWGTTHRLSGDYWDVLAFARLRPVAAAYCAADQREFYIRRDSFDAEPIAAPPVVSVAPLPCDKVQPRDFIETVGGPVDEQDYATALAAALTLTGRGALTVPVDWHGVDASLSGWGCLTAHCIVSGQITAPGEFRIVFYGDAVRNENLVVIVTLENHVLSKLRVAIASNHPEV